MAAARGLGIIFGGGRIGMMGVVSDAAFESGGYVHGVIPEFLETLEVASTSITDLTVTKTMHERKKIMYAEGDIFLALPGGFGTMEEILEVITWRQLRVHDKPIMLFNTNGFWDPLITMFKQSSELGFLRPEHLKLFRTSTTLDELADFFDLFT
jgi:uncharacterized protein (TIGR00730 family)